MYRVTIKYGVRPNKNERVGGFLPYIREEFEEGFEHERGDKWSGAFYSKDDAMSLAKDWAETEGGRYGGDYDVNIAQDSKYDQ